MSVYVPVVETRELDTRPASNIGPNGPFASETSRKLLLTGIIATDAGDQRIVPAGATAEVYNLTVVDATAAGFVAMRSGDATGTPSTSSRSPIQRVSERQTIPQRRLEAILRVSPNA